MNGKIHLLGAGSLGLLLAARLSAVADICLVRRSGEYPAALDLTLEEDGARQALALPQCSPERLAAPVRRLLLCTKAYDALPALQALGDRLAADAELLLMQNGMGSQQAIAAAFPQAGVHAASTTEGANRPAPGRVVHAGRGITRIGRLSGAPARWTALFRAAGLVAEEVEPIEWHLANKLRINALINPLTVFFDCRNGELLERPQVVEWMRRLGEEADAVLGAIGFRFEEPAFEVAAEVCRRTAANHSSMLQDARAGRRLELDYINGYLVRSAERLGMEAPRHRGLCERLSAAGAAPDPAGRGS